MTASSSGSSILVRWQDESDDEDGFVIYRADGNADTAEIARAPANTTEYRDSTMEVGVNYSYAVASFNSAGNSQVVVQDGEPVFVKPGQPSEPTPPDDSTPPSDTDPPDSADPSDPSEPSDPSDPSDPELIRVTSTSGGTGGPQCTLRDAITAANEDQETGGCKAGSGPDTIELPADSQIELSQVDNQTEGGNTLPVVTSQITILGRNSELTRTANAPENKAFRILLISDAGDLDLRDTVLTNAAPTPDSVEELQGGAVFNQGSLRLERVTLQGHTAEEGGAIRNVGVAEVLNSELLGNRARGPLGAGGGIRNSGRLELTTSLLESNHGLHGGGINNDGTMTITDSKIDGNGGWSGGGIENSGTLDITASNVSNNDIGREGYGGGINNYGTLAIENSKVDGNKGGWHGGGINNDLDGAITIRNSSVSYNHTFEDGGGGINIESGALVVENSVVRGNTTEQWGAGIGSRAGNVTVSSGSIITENVNMWREFSSAAGIADSGRSELSLAPGAVFNNIPYDVGHFDRPNDFTREIETVDDDAEEYLSDTGNPDYPAGTVHTSDIELDLGFDASRGSNQLVGLRFPDIPIPRGARVLHAHLQFDSSDDDSSDLTLTIYGEASGNGEPFVDGRATFGISSRPRTSASVSWNPPDWSGRYENAKGLAQRPPDLRAILEEIVAREDWEPGNALVLMIAGPDEHTARRRAYSLGEEHRDPPTLIVEFEPE